jgi:hypothetical protein
MFISSLLLIAGLLAGGPATNPPDPTPPDAAPNEPVWDNVELGSCGCKTTCPQSILVGRRVYGYRGCVSVKAWNQLICMYAYGNEDSDYREHSCGV